MNKIVPGLCEALADIPDGAVILIGGFGGSGNPHNLIDGLVQRGTKDLTVVSNDWTQWTSLLENGQVRKIISGFTNHPFRPQTTVLAEELCRAGKVDLETMPHGILEERIRAAKVGISALYCPVGVGTVVEEGREKKNIAGKECLLHYALKADFALVKGYRADRLGNIQCRFAAGNRNVTMAGAADVTIAEVEQIAEVGEIEPERVTIPGIFVDRVVKAPKVVRWLDGHEVPGYLTPKRQSPAN